MRDDEDRALEPRQEVLQPRDAEVIEVVCRLVEDQKIRPREKRLREEKHVLLAARERADALGRAPREAQRVEHGDRAVLERISLDPLVVLARAFISASAACRLALRRRREALLRVAQRRRARVVLAAAGDRARCRRRRTRRTEARSRRARRARCTQRPNPAPRGRVVYREAWSCLSHWARLVPGAAPELTVNETPSSTLCVPQDFVTFWTLAMST